MGSELARRIAFTLGALLVYRLGAMIPLPGLDLAALAQIFNRQPTGILSSSSIGRLSLLELTLVPYLTATFLLQMVALVSRRLRASWTESERGRVIAERWTRLLTAILAAAQSYGIAQGLARVPGIVTDPGPTFITTTVLTMTAGVFFLIWLSGQITARGIGNGIVLILFAGFASALPSTIVSMLELSRIGALAPGMLQASAVLTVAAVVIIVAVERARRRLPVQFSPRQAGDRTLPGQATDIALKINPGGIMPIIMTLALLTIVIALATLADVADPRQLLAVGTPAHLLVSGVLIILFSLVYAAFVYDPERMAGQLKAYGGAIPDVAPGEATAAHLDGVISRIAIVGTVYLLLLALLPAVVIMLPGLPLYSGTIWLMILVCIVLDIEAQVRALMAEPSA